MPDDQVISVYAYKVGRTAEEVSFCVDARNEFDTHASAHSGEHPTIKGAANYLNCWLRDRLSENKDLRFNVFFVPEEGTRLHISRLGSIAYIPLDNAETEEFCSEVMAANTQFVAV